MCACIFTVSFCRNVAFFERNVDLCNSCEFSGSDSILGVITARSCLIITVHCLQLLIWNMILAVHQFGKPAVSACSGDCCVAAFIFGIADVTSVHRAYWLRTISIVRAVPNRASAFALRPALSRTHYSIRYALTFTPCAILVLFCILSAPL